MARSERGATLLESVISLAILAIAAAALLGGVATGTTAAGLHRQQSDDEVVLTSAGEALQDNLIVAYQHCAITSTYDIDHALSTYPGFNFPSTSGIAWTVSDVAITGVQYWNGTAWQASCVDPSDGVNDEIQLVQITVTNPARGVVMSRDYIKAPSS